MRHTTLVFIFALIALDIPLNAETDLSTSTQPRSFSHPVLPKATQNAPQKTIVPPLSNSQMRKRCLAALNHMRTLSAHFTEKIPKKPGFVKTGTLAIQRPNAGQSGFGSLRVTYKNPPILDISSQGRKLVILNRQNNVRETLPMTSTPLRLILRNNLSLGQFVREKSLKNAGGKVFWTLTDADETGGGYVTLVFDNHSFALLGWHIRDVYGNVIDVSLDKVKINTPLPSKTFLLPKGRS